MVKLPTFPIVEVTIGNSVGVDVSGQAVESWGLHFPEYKDCFFGQSRQ